MGKWAERLAEKTATPPLSSTDKTAKRGVLSVLSVAPEVGTRDFRAEPEPATARPYKLSRTDADRCHFGGWNDAEIETFTARTLLFLRRGINATDVDDLAERLTLRDRDIDERRLCLECSHYTPGRCGNHRGAGLNVPEIGRDLPVALQRCSGFAPC